MRFNVPILLFYFMHIRYAGDKADGYQEPIFSAQINDNLLFLFASAKNHSK